MIYGVFSKYSWQYEDDPYNLHNMDYGINDLYTLLLIINSTIILSMYVFKIKLF